MGKADHTLDSEKQKPIPQSVSAAALLLIEWLREQIQMGESNKTECQQSSANDHHEQTKRNSR